MVLQMVLLVLESSFWNSLVVSVLIIITPSALEECSSRAEEETSFSTQNIEITSTFLEENIEAESTTIEGALFSYYNIILIML